MAANRLRVHGITNCTTVRAARSWLREHGVGHEWIDFRTSPPSADDIARWSRAVGIERLLNRRGTTWRSLDRETQARVRDEASAIALMHEHPTLIKRPVVESGDELIVGFAADDYARRFA